MIRHAGLAAVLLLAACGRRDLAPPEILGEINNEYLTTDEYLHHFKARGGLALAGPARDQLKAMLVAELVDRRLLLTEARRRRIKPVREDVRREFDALGRTGWEPVDRAAAWNVDDDMYEQRQIEILLQRVVPAPEPPGRAAVATWLAGHPEAVRRPSRLRIAQVVVHSSAMANELRGLLERGVTLAAAARGLRLAEAEPRWVAEADLPDELREAALGAVTGAVIGPVASAYGYHVAVVSDRRAAGALPAAEAERLGRRRLLAERRDEAARRFVVGLRREAVIRLDRSAIARL